jgi:hypothetical protein
MVVQQAAQGESLTKTVATSTTTAAADARAATRAPPVPPSRTQLWHLGAWRWSGRRGSCPWRCRCAEEKCEEYEKVKRREEEKTKVEAHLSDDGATTAAHLLHSPPLRAA